MPYLTALALGFVLAQYLGYLQQYPLPVIPTIKGQSPMIWMGAVAVGCAALLWLAYVGRPASNALMNWFLGGLMGVWLCDLLLLRLHGDGYDYSVWLYPLVVGMLWAKAPRERDIRGTLILLGWALSAILALTRVLELAGAFTEVPIPRWLVDFEVGEYWLPLSGGLGPEGRWPGPMGGTAFTGMLGAMLLVLGVSLKIRSSWVFGTVGFFTLLLTSSRGAYAAAAVGVAVALLFGGTRWLQWISVKWRVSLAIVGVLATFGLLLKSSPSLTGRTTFWPDFVGLWATSPITGVGATGYDSGTAWTSSAKSAHSLFLDELARNGILGLVLVLVVLSIAIVIAIKAARIGFSGPLALLAAFLVLGVANTPMSWKSPSIMWLLFALPIMWAGTKLAERPSSELETVA
jgi:hypothetical protein